MLIAETIFAHFAAKPHRQEYAAHAITPSSLVQFVVEPGALLFVAEKDCGVHPDCKMVQRRSPRCLRVCDGVNGSNASERRELERTDWTGGSSVLSVRG